MAYKLLPTATIVAGLALFPLSIASGQVVQLPSYRTFSYTGGAVVPDQGTGILGGTTFSRQGSAYRGAGPYAGRATGFSSMSSSVAASAQVIDLKALDEAILAANVPLNTTGSAPLSYDADSDGRSTLSSTGESQASVRRGHPFRWQRVLAGGGSDEPPLNQGLAESNVRYYLRMGKEAERADRILSARVYYRMAVDAMTPEMMVRYQRILEQQRLVAEEQERAAQDVNGRRNF